MSKKYMDKGKGRAIPGMKKMLPGKVRSIIQCFMMLVLLLAAAATGRLDAQQAVVTLDRGQILLGEQVTLQLKVENLTDEAQQITDWFRVADSAQHIEVVDRGKMDTITVDGQTTLMQKLTITSFDSGSWVIPVISPKVRDVNGQQYELKADSVTLDVMPVDVSKMNDFHPEKDIIAVDYKDYTWLYITGAVLLLALLGFITYRLVKRYRNRPKRAARIIKGPPLDWALSQIDLLVAENLIAEGKAKEFYTRLNDICRTYFDERIRSHTFQSTSQEMIEKLQTYLTRQKDRAALVDFTRLSDYVKFAEHLPEQQKTAEAVEIARETLRNVEKQVLESGKVSSKPPVDPAGDKKEHKQEKEQDDH